MLPKQADLGHFLPYMGSKVETPLSVHVGGSPSADSFATHCLVPHSYLPLTALQTLQTDMAPRRIEKKKVSNPTSADFQAADTKRHSSLSVFPIEILLEVCYL